MQMSMQTPTHTSMHMHMQPSVPTHEHSGQTRTDNSASTASNSSSTNHQLPANHTHNGIPFLHPWQTRTDNSAWTASNSSSTNHQLPANHTHNGIPFLHPWHRLNNDNANTSVANNSSSNASLSTHSQYIYHGTGLWSNLSLNGTSSASSINLDLSSTTSSMTAGHMLHGQTIDISVGGNQLNVTANTKLTPAEYLAVQQVKLTGQQTLILDSQGSASGGTVVIGQHLSQLISNLVIPQGVTVIDLTKSGTLNLSGNITDNGNLYIDSRNPLLSSVTLDASNINVQGQGTLSDVIPAGTLSSVNNGHASLDTNLSLSLDAVNNITNAGSITSSGNVNLVSGSGNITNNGLIASTNGSINIATAQPTTNLNITSNGGTFQALNGAINLRDASYNGAANINVTGGNLLSQQLNINAGSGAAAINVGQLTGTVNTYAGSAHIEALTPDLNLGVLNVTGDPFVSNNAGNLNLSSVTFPATYLVATASGSIYTSSSSTDINTSSSSGNGGNVVLAAGVTSTDNSGAISLTRSGTGGDIYLTTGTTLNGNATQNITGFNTSTSNSGSNGGNVTLIAMSSAAGNNTGGHVYLPSTVQITSQGAGSGVNGNITIVAEATQPSANAISMGGVATANTTFGTGGGGNVNIIVATPNLSGVTINDSTGAITGSVTSTNYQNGGITLGAGGVYSPATVNIEGGSITANGVISANTINLTTAPDTNGNITLNGNVTATNSVTITANGSGSIITPTNVIATITAGGDSYVGGVAINSGPSSML